MSRPLRRVLLIDDDILFGRAVRDHFAPADIEVLEARSAAEALVIAAEVSPDVIVLDQKLPDGPGQALCAPLRDAHPTAKIVFITAFPSFDSAVSALKAGAHDYLSKPFELGELEHAVRRGIRTIELERAERARSYQDEKDRESTPFVAGPGLHELRDLLAVAAGADAPVLLTGETGTGKGLLARAIHHGGARRTKPFISLNLAALPETLVEAELFGWERGAFTGAVGSREGVLEMAAGGTLLLDEIGEMPVHLQAKLLSVLEDREVRRLGSRTSRSVDVRIVAATNADLEERIATQRFRADLYYRLDVIRLHLPPLRERAEDLPALCEHLLGRMAGAGKAPRLAEGEDEKLMAYDWPGNIRELRNVLERSLLLHTGELRPSSLLSARQRDPRPSPPQDLRPSASEQPVTLEVLEQRYIERTLESHQGNLARTARALGISLSTLKRKLRR